MKGYSLLRKATISILFVAFCIFLSLSIALNVSNAKVAKAERSITVNGQDIDISSFATYPSASVRLVSEDPGIRFITGIDEDVYDALISATEDTDWSVTFGTIITYKSRVDDESVSDFTKAELDKLVVSEGSKYMDCEATSFLSNPIISGNKEFSAVLKVKDRNFQAELTARGYMVVSDGTSETIYYADYEDFSRNTTWVAKKAIENIITLGNKKTASLEILDTYAKVGDDGYNMVKTSNDANNSGLIKVSTGTSSIGIADFGNRNDVYTFVQTNSTNKWINRLEPALISPSLEWADSDSGSANALARQKALGLNYFKFDFLYKYSQKGETDFSLYYPTSSGEHGIVNFNNFAVSSDNADWNDYVKVYNETGVETTTLAYSQWYTVVVDISCNLDMEENANPQVAIVENNTNVANVNPLCFDNVIFYRGARSSLNTPANVTESSGVVSWDAVSGATSYNIKVNQYCNGEVKTTYLTSDTNSIDLTAYGECEVCVQAANSIGDTSSYSSICSNRTDVIADFKSTDSASLIASTTTAGLNGSTVDSTKYNNDGTVEVDVKSSYRNQNFNIEPPALDTTKAGIVIRFKVVISGYYAGNSFTFRFAGPTNSENYGISSTGYSATQDSVAVTVGEWQTLVLPMDAVILDRTKTIAWPGNGHYEYGNVNREKLYFTLLANNGQSTDTPIAIILIDDISYCVAPETPTNVSFEDGILTWDEVFGAASYKVKVNQYNNGELTTTNLVADTNSIDLSSYGECEVSVQAVNGVGETSSYSAIYSNRTNVIFDFNSEPESAVIASTTTASGLTASEVKSITYNDDGTVEIKVCSSYQNQNFNIKPTSALDTTKAGIAIRFKVVTSGYSDKTFTFQLAGPSLQENYSTTYNSVAVTVGEWQTLVLPMDAVVLDRTKTIAWPGNGHYEYGNANREKLYFTLRANAGQNGNPVATILIDDISYITAD
ncbi:MAG: hypothetical protein IJQ23_06310 [Clostridia bacterium]|nr:hypothetical protein [Clostridia bacterium]MBR0189981.1 hypothetical protein [Clostridia bacterium]